MCYYFAIVLKAICFSVFQSGKTVLANFLSDTTENVGGEYRPTQGVRYKSYVSFTAFNIKPLRVSL